MEKKKERDFATDVEIQINKVDVKAKHENNEVLKVVFETNKGNISWKPKIEQTEMIRGISVSKVVPCSFDDLPEKIFELSREVNEKGFVKVKASYSIWNTTNDGEPVTYRFIQGDKMFDKWVIIKEETTEQVG